MSYLVALTEEIRQPGSLIARFLRAQFPALTDLAADFEQQVRGAQTLAPEHPGPDYPWSLVGTAIDYRIRFLFEVLPVYRLPAFKSAQGSHVADQGTVLGEYANYSYGPNGAVTVFMPKVAADLFTELRDFLRRVRPARRSLSTDDEEVLCRYCAALALVGTSIRRRSTHPLRALPPGATLDDVFGLVPREAIVDICQLSRHFEKSTGREWFRRTVTINPFIGIGNIGATPDVMVGDCLLDLKTTRHPQMDRAWLDQLLVYSLALGDRAKMKHVGFHLVRQALTVSWPIDQFLARAAESTNVDIERLISMFVEVAVRSSTLPPQERWHATT